jgi:hypothetical protein
MHDIFRIRRATVQDADIIAWHRARMFQDVGDVSDYGFEILRSKARLRLKEWLESGDYIGWLATPADKQETVVGGAGIQLQRILPRPRDASIIGESRQGTIVNVLPNRNGDGAESPAGSLKRSSLGRRRRSRSALTSRVGRWALSLRTARIHRRQRNAFRRRFLVLPLDDAESVSELAETSFIVAGVRDAMM